jgi:hypothetical protein
VLVGVDFDFVSFAGREAVSLLFTDELSVSIIEGIPKVIIEAVTILRNGFTSLPRRVSQAVLLKLTGRAPTDRGSTRRIGHRLRRSEFEDSQRL